jgi:hypothetical protein
LVVAAPVQPGGAAAAIAAPVQPGCAAAAVPVEPSAAAATTTAATAARLAVEIAAITEYTDVFEGSKDVAARVMAASNFTKEDNANDAAAKIFFQILYLFVPCPTGDTIVSYPP